MHYTGEVYRHPMEAYTPLLEVTIGCSHNKCSFCTMYRKTPFKMSPLEHIKEDLEELKSYGGHIDRIYLVNADPFVLSAEKLIIIGELINSYFPEIKTITGYASIKNIKNKSVDDLKKMRALGFNQFHIGLETAYDPALKMMNKGFTNAEAYEQLDKLEQAGIEYDALLMLGVAGRDAGIDNTKATIDLLSRYKPYMISIMPTSVTPGSELEEICNSGDYVELTEREMLLEEIKFLEALDVDDDCFFFGSHNFNLVPVSGEMKDRNIMIYKLKFALKTLSPKILDSTKPRGSI
ncbi:radical SAM protein [Candidatus Epulonipiscium fishelsonii]|uniref:Radical SAM protein n=1 Tax=Candidatus Epulonipiscium fishelsonii TaxID=77094 RepID=A0ACC8XCV3_9FIRM|nr:radical SAM protein [Epulopiscium sp. SCG-B11WGA-EpuloA1]ONI41777.1 radical SAM protein [Epulopiscium sp. SCG-B05WGA-EpuloA1]